MAAVETAQKLYTAWHAGDMPTAMSLMSDDIVLYVWNPTVPGAKPGVPMSGIWKSKDGVGQYFKALHESLDLVRFDILGWAGAGKEVFVKVFVEASVKATGKTFKTDMLHNWTLNDAGLFSQMAEFCDTDAVVKAHQAD